MARSLRCQFKLISSRGCSWDRRARSHKVNTGSTYQHFSVRGGVEVSHCELHNQAGRQAGRQPAYRAQSVQEGTWEWQ